MQFHIIPLLYIFTIKQLRDGVLDPCANLDLRRVEVHGDDVVGAGHRQHVRHQLG